MKYNKLLTAKKQLPPLGTVNRRKLTFRGLRGGFCSRNSCIWETEVAWQCSSFWMRRGPHELDQTLEKGTQITWYCSLCSNTMRLILRGGKTVTCNKILTWGWKSKTYDIDRTRKHKQEDNLNRRTLSPSVFQPCSLLRTPHWKSLLG